jgi:hypothetical protein
MNQNMKDPGARSRFAAVLSHVTAFSRLIERAGSPEDEHGQCEWMIVTEAEAYAGTLF